MNACKGNCCIEGDSGAPLLDEEEEILNKIYEKWDLLCSEIGIVTDTGNFEVFKNDIRVANIPVDTLVLGGGAPEYDMPVKEPEYFSKMNNFSIESILEADDYNKTLLTLQLQP